jgi:hypothetical protein
MENFRTNGIDFIIFIIFLTASLLSIILNKMQAESDIVQFLINSKGNILGIITASFFFNCFGGLKNLKERILVSIYVCVGLIIYELFQKILPWTTFDKMDIYGTFFGFLLTIIMNIIVFKKGVNRSLE